MPPTAGEIPMVDAFRRRVAETPHAVALTVGDEQRTFAGLESATDRLARSLLAEGVGTGDVVAIGLPNSVAFIEAALATLKAGGTPLPVSHRLPAAERRAVVDLADARLVIGAPPPDHPGRRTVAGFSELAGADSDEPLPVRVSPSWKAATSGGSTGRPKLIITTTPAVIDDEGRPDYLLPRRSVVLIPGPLHHTAPFAMAMLALFHGNHLVVEPRFDAATAAASIARHRPEFVLLVPTMMHRLWRLAETEGGVDLSSLQTVFHMAAPCPAWLKRAWIDWLGAERIFELYGASDSPANTVITGREWLEHPGSVGRAALGEIQVTDDDGCPLPPGEVGEIWMRPPPGRESRSRVVGGDARTRDGWTSVGDLGWMDDDGYLYISDRRTDLILSGGENVYTAEVEAALEAHPGVCSAVVVGLPDHDLGQRVHAVVETDPGVGEAALRAHMASLLVPYKTPRSYDFTTGPLRDDAGKVRKAAVVAAALAREELVAELESARSTRALVTPPSARIAGFSLADGFAVGWRLAERRVAAGSRRAGQKIGLTFRPTWERVGISHPLWAPMYWDTVVETGPSGGELNVKALTMPRLEIEVVFGLRTGLAPGAGLGEVAAAVEWAALGYEVVDCHYPDWKCLPPDIVADHGLHAGLVIGGRRSVTPDEVLALDHLGVVLTTGGTLVAQGAGTDVLGGPAQAVVELLASPFASPLAAGELISTGALTRGAHPLSAGGETWRAEASGPVALDAIEVGFRA